MCRRPSLWAGIRRPRPSRASGSGGGRHPVALPHPQELGQGHGLLGLEAAQPEQVEVAALGAGLRRARAKEHAGVRLDQRGQRVDGQRVQTLDLDAGQDALRRPQELLVAPKLLVLRQESAALEAAMDLELQRLGIQRLDQIVERTAAERPHRRLRRADAGEHEHVQRGIELFGALQELEAVHLGHQQIRHEDVPRFGRQADERFDPVRRDPDLMSAGAQRIRKDRAHQPIIVCNQDPAGEGGQIDTPNGILTPMVNFSTVIPGICDSLHSRNGRIRRQPEAWESRRGCGRA